MHELAICETIIRVVEEEAKKRGMKKVSRVKLKIGKMQAFDKENLNLSLLGQTSKLFSNVNFDIDEVPVELECTACHKNFLDERFDDMSFAHKISHAPAFYVVPACPACGCDKPKLIAGNELLVVSIE